MFTPLPTRPRLSTSAANRIAVVASNYNAEFVEPMLAKTLEEITLIEPNSRTDVYRTPGAFEIPYFTRQLISRVKPDVIICLGVIFRGETSHADLIAASVTDALCRISVETLTPVIHEVLLLENRQQAQDRCLGDEMNRGTEAARTALEVFRNSLAITTR